MSVRLVSGADPRRYVAALAVVALAYYLAGRIGLELAYLDGAVAALWPPAGVGLAVLFLYGVRLWPAIVIGDLLLGDYSTPLGTVAAQTFGNTLALVVAALLLRRLTGGRGGLERVTDVVAFVTCALVAALISAASGIVTSAFQIGGAMGLALVSTAATARVTDALASGAAQPDALAAGFQRGMLIVAGLAVANPLIGAIRAPRITPDAALVAEAAAA